MLYYEPGRFALHIMMMMNLVNLDIFIIGKPVICFKKLHAYLVLNFLSSD